MVLASKPSTTQTTQLLHFLPKRRIKITKKCKRCLSKSQSRSKTCELGSRSQCSQSKSLMKVERMRAGSQSSIAKSQAHQGVWQQWTREGYTICPILMFSKGWLPVRINCRTTWSMGALDQLCLRLRLPKGPGTGARASQKWAVIVTCISAEYSATTSAKQLVLYMTPCQMLLSNKLWVTIMEALLAR